MKSALLLLVLAATLHAQTATPPPAPAATASKILYFRSTLPGGTFQVAVSAITAVASHEYLVDGVARVTEVNIDTTGSLVARYYYIEPALPSSPVGLGNATIEKAQELFKEAAERSGQDAWKKVVKNYPTTTHARTIEYRVTDREHLTRIFNAAEEAFRLVKTMIVKID
jgi:hypothetical protein